MGGDLVAMGYLMPWIVVIGAGLSTLVGVYAITRPIPSLYLKTLLRSLSMVILLLPAPVPAFEGQFAPAFVVLLFEAAFQTDGNPLPALQFLIGGCIAVVALVSGFFFWKARRE